MTNKTRDAVDCSERVGAAPSADVGHEALRARQAREFAAFANADGRLPRAGWRLSELPRPPLQEAVLLILQLMDAVGRFHARGVIHRDIKPSNIIVMEGGELRLIDFDVAAYWGARSTLPGHEDVRIGTLPYSAPEQILDPATATYETADIFSLGVVLYEMLTGRIPFPMADDEDEEEYRSRLPFADPVPPTVYRPDLAPEIEAVLLKAICRDSAGRHHSVAELRAELEAAFRAAGLDVRSDDGAGRRWLSSILIAAPLIGLLGWLFLTA